MQGLFASKLHEFQAGTSLFPYITQRHVFEKYSKNLSMSLYFFEFSFADSYEDGDAFNYWKVGLFSCIPSHEEL